MSFIKLMVAIVQFPIKIIYIYIFWADRNEIDDIHK